MGKNNVNIGFDGKKYYFTVGDTIIYIDSVHQLQNLFAAITGEELTLKNK